MDEYALYSIQELIHDNNSFVDDSMSYLLSLIVYFDHSHTFFYFLKKNFAYHNFL